jgi:hypothetical protein
MPLSHDCPHTEYLQVMQKFFGTISLIVLLTFVGVPGTLEVNGHALGLESSLAAENEGCYWMARQTPDSHRRPCGGDGVG